MKYKTGNIVELYSWDKLVELSKNDKLYFNNNPIKIYSNDVFGIDKQDYVKLSKELLTIVYIDDTSFNVKETFYGFPLCFIKNQLVCLPDELFQM